MSYLVEIVGQRLEQSAGERSVPLYTLQRRFSKISLAEHAGQKEVESLRRNGKSVFYKISDPEGRLIGTDCPD
jgi:hypothetical protein